MIHKATTPYLLNYNNLPSITTNQIDRQRRALFRCRQLVDSYGRSCDIATSKSFEGCVCTLRLLCNSTAKPQIINRLVWKSVIMREIWYHAQFLKPSLVPSCCSTTVYHILRETLFIPVNMSEFWCWMDLQAEVTYRRMKFCRRRFSPAFWCDYWFLLRSNLCALLL